MVVVFVRPSHTPTSSPEVAFADTSFKSGLSIVPASCPSGPMQRTQDGLGQISHSGNLNNYDQNIS